VADPFLGYLISGTHARSKVHKVPIVLVNRSEGVGYATGVFVNFFRQRGPASLRRDVDDELGLRGSSDDVRIFESREGYLEWNYVISTEPPFDTRYVLP
jgi:hypothetical protein